VSPAFLIALTAATTATTMATPPMWLYHVTHKEEQRIHLYDEEGRLRTDQAKRLERLMRCHHSGKRHRINLRLIRLLHRVWQRYPGRRIEIVSGYRDRKYSKTRRSAHTRGRAVDFRVQGVENADLRDYVRGFARVGVGYYPRSSFVHLDVRVVPAFWVDYSGPGQRARYSEDPLRDLVIERLLRAGK